MQAVKQGFVRRILRKLRADDPLQGSLWTQHWTAGTSGTRDSMTSSRSPRKKHIEKLRYMHRNPVKRGLVLEPQQWAWSSYRHYADGERGIVLVNEEQKVEMKVRKIA